MATKNHLPFCQCYDICNEQAEWSIVYGNSVTDDYAFSCSNHIGDIIKNISNGRHGNVFLFYAEHYSVLPDYDEKWNTEWARYYSNKKKK